MLPAAIWHFHSKVWHLQNNRVQNALTYDHNLYCLQWLEKINLTKNCVWWKFFSWCAGIKLGCQARAVRRMTYQFDALADQKSADLTWCVKAHIAMVNYDSSSVVRFSNLFEDIVVHHSELTVQRCSSGTVTIWPEYLLRSKFSTAVDCLP